jgi:APA family basic amino acid/polyamine antiporter
VNVLGARLGAKVQDTTVVLKLVTLAGLVALAALVPSGARGGESAAGPGVSPLGFAGLFAGVTITMFSYGGGQQALWVSGEVVDARRTVPRAILLGVLVVLFAYLAANWAYLDLLGFEGTRDSRTLAADAFSAAWPGAGRRVAAAAVAASAFGVLNAQFQTGPRLTWAMARDGRFFAPFARLHDRFGTPAPAILLLGVLATGLMLSLGLDRTDLLTTGVVVVDAVFFALTGFALPLLRRITPPAERGPGWIVAAAVAFSVLELLAVAGSVVARDARLIALSGLAWVGGAAVTWWVFFRRRAAP